LSRQRSINRKVLRPGIAAISALGFAAVLLGISPAQANIPTYEIGDTGPGGGVVFITPSTAGNSTGKYFEVRASGVERNGCNSGTFRNPFGTEVVDRAIGAGSANTRAIADQCDLGGTEATSAFIWARNASLGGFTDWFVPSRGEADRLEAERGSSLTIDNLVKSLIKAPATIHFAWLSEVVNDPPVTAQVYVFDAGGGSTNGSTDLGGGSREFFIVRMFSPAQPVAPVTSEGGRTVLPPLEYVLGFNANGGSCSLSNSGQIIDGVWIQVPTAEQCSRPGFRLLGWNPKPDGSDPLGFDPGGWTLMTDDNTLFAIWVPSG